MSLIQHSFFPRSLFDVDPWFQPRNLGLGYPSSTLDVFDPFDELDRLMTRNLFWLNEPEIVRNVPSIAPKVPKKFRVTADIRGYNPKSIKTEISQDKSKLTISGSEGEPKKEGEEDYNIREFRKSYKLPENAETDKLISFATGNNKLVVEIPLKEEEPKEDLFPRILEGESGKKELAMNMSLPSSIDPSRIKVTCKDRDLIVQAEDRQEKPDSFSQISYYRRTTLPDTTDFNTLKCHFENNCLSIKASVNPESSNFKNIPIEMGQQQQLKIEQTQPQREEQQQQPSQQQEQIQQQPSQQQGEQKQQQMQQEESQQHEQKQPQLQEQKQQQQPKEFTETQFTELERPSEQAIKGQEQPEQTQTEVSQQQGYYQQQYEAPQQEGSTQKPTEEQQLEGKGKAKSEIPMENIEVERER